MSGFPGIGISTRSLVFLGMLSAWVGLIYPLAAQAQMSPEEHAKHHPGQSQAPAAGVAPGGSTPLVPPADAGKPAGAEPPGGMGGMMDGMMKKMGIPAPRDVYPSLMNLPELKPDQREQIQGLAKERLRTGVALMSKGVDRLVQAAENEDYAAMQESTVLVREALAQFESGLAAQRVLVEGQPPRQVALHWFKGEMNLLLPQGAEASRSSSGLSILHIFTMALLIVFALAMLVMYYFKMRRAAALFGRIEPDSSSPPTGTPSPQDGGGGPSPLPGGQSPPPEGPSPTAVPKSRASTTRTKTDASTRPPDTNAASGPTGKHASPVTSKWRGQLGIECITPETPNIKTFRFRSPGGGPLPFTFIPGQFLNLPLSIGGARMNRSYSISSSPHERDYVELSVKREERGAVSRHIVDLWKVGDLIEAGGPVGKFTFNGTEADSVVLISAGVGITPMMSIARFLSEQAWPGEIFFIFTCRNPTDYIFEKALAALASRNRKLHVVVTMTKPSPDWKGPRGRITRELLAQSVPDIASRRVHICGPLTMMETTKVLLSELGVASDRVKAEAFGAVKPRISGPNDPSKPKTAGTGPVVTFYHNNKTAKIHTDQTILELSEELAIGIENSCRVGTCGICKVKMTSGEVEMAVEDSLDADEKAHGIILACQAKPNTAVTVEA